MADPLQTGTSALLAYQRAIATTSHNIANSATEGYTRQRVDFQASPAIERNYGFVGQGVDLYNIERLEDKFANAQLLQTGSELSRLSALHGYASQVDSLLSTSALTLTPSLNKFFSALDDANNNPTDMATRIGVVNNAENLTSNFRSLYDGLEASRQQMLGDLSGSVSEINELTIQIANLDQSIQSSSNSSNSRAPNDLLDQRNNLVGQLSEQVDIHTVEAKNGSLDIYIANGQSLLTGGITRTLETVNDNSIPGGVTIAISDGGGSQIIGEKLSGGRIGGLNEFNKTVLTPAVNELGRMAISLSVSMNEQHMLGIDINGDFGRALFSTPGIDVASRSTNTGSASVTANLTDASAITLSDYEVEFNGVDYTLTRLSDSSQVSGGTILSMDGLSVDISGSMVSGDSFLIAPTRYAARELSVSLLNGENLALGSPLRTRTALANTSNADISITEIADTTDPDFATPVNLVFNDPVSSFNVVERDTGTVLATNVAYAPGDDVSYNGWVIQVRGAPSSGDIFTIEQNLGGIANNENGLQLSNIQHQNLVDKSANLSQVYGSLIANVGTRTRQSELNSDAMQSMHNSVIERRENTSGVNLDEEAINLTRYQQAYQAAAQIITTADQMFQALIGAIR